MTSIIISLDTPERDRFADWLRDRGYDAQLGIGTGSFIDGERTSHNEVANMIMNSLWEEFRNQ